MNVPVVPVKTKTTTSTQLPSSRFGAVAGCFGPACFIGGWVASGLLRPGYSALRQPISQLARLGAPHRYLMTAAFIGFGASMPVFARTLSRSLGNRRLLQVSATIAGLATLGVAAFPLSRSGGGTEDLIHGGWATFGYVGQALSPMLGGWALYQRGLHKSGVASVALGAIAAAALSATPFVESVGFFQRLGLTVVDCWFLTMASLILSGQDFLPNT